MATAPVVPKLVYSAEEGFFVPIDERRRQKRQASSTTNYIDVYMEIQFAKLRSVTGLQANIHFNFGPAAGASSGFKIGWAKSRFTIFWVLPTLYFFCAPAP